MLEGEGLLLSSLLTCPAFRAGATRTLQAWFQLSLIAVPLKQWGQDKTAVTVPLWYPGPREKAECGPGPGALKGL